MKEAKENYYKYNVSMLTKTNKKLTYFFDLSNLKHICALIPHLC